jgi:N-methylhydantoinase A
VADFCIGVDVGGTFTDAVLTDGEQVWTAKVPTTPAVGEGVVAACQLVAERSGASLREVLSRSKRFGLGTTAVTNTIAARRGARVGLLTTSGFEETLRLSRGRLAVTDRRLHHGPQLVDSKDIVGVNERVDRHGAVVKPLDLDEVVEATARLLAGGVESIALSFLWSMVNPDHEARAAEAIAQEWPDVPVTSGADLLPVLREYERTTLAVLNAYVSKAFSGIEELARRLAEDGLAVPLLLVHSGGGTISVAEARSRPVWLAESGPAAGVAAAAAWAARSGATRCLTCDMGGTSFDVSHVQDGGPSRVQRGDLMGIWTALPRLDVESIGAGGGSIAWVDAREMLRVGPQSAGSSPGPVCYGRGGDQPTVTDALVVLRYIDPGNFLGGDMILDHNAAVAACAALGARLGLDADAAAWGIREIALAEMTKAVRTRLAMRGLDPRQHPLVSYGGCASLFTADIAKALSATKVIIPHVASVLSAQGAATSDVRRERVRTVLAEMPFDVSELEKLGDELATRVDGDLAADGVAVADRRVSLEADLRFVRQMWELTIPLPSAPIDEAAVDRLLEGFRQEYALRYGAGSISLGTPVELVAVRAVGIGSTIHGELTPRLDGAGDGAGAGHGTDDLRPGRTRSVRFGSADDAQADIAVYDDNQLVVGQALWGPAIIDRSDTTIWVPDGVRASRDANGSVVLEVR